MTLRFFRGVRTFASKNVTEIKWKPFLWKMLLFCIFSWDKKINFFLQFLFSISLWPSNLPLMERTWHSHFTSFFVAAAVQFTTTTTTTTTTSRATSAFVSLHYLDNDRMLWNFFIFNRLFYFLFVFFEFISYISRIIYTL
jgi:hypothetical protein